LIENGLKNSLGQLQKIGLDTQESRFNPVEPLLILTLSVVALALPLLALSLQLKALLIIPCNLLRKRGLVANSKAMASSR